MKPNESLTCSGCTFIAVDEIDEPCRSCVRGIFAGKTDNYSRELDPKLDLLSFKLTSAHTREK